MRKGTLLFLLLCLGVWTNAHTQPSAYPSKDKQIGPHTTSYSFTSTRQHYSNISSDSTKPHIISLSPAATELIYDLGLQAHLIAVDQNSNYPEQAKQLPNIGNAFSPNKELLALLHPDIVISFTSSPLLEKIQKHNTFQWLIIQPKNIDDLLSKAKDLIKILRANNPHSNTHTTENYVLTLYQQAQQKIKEWEAFWQKHQHKYQNTPRKKVFVFLDGQPIYALGKNTFLSQSLTICGAENIFPSIEQPSFIISAEELALHRPDMVIAGIAPSQNYQKKQKSIRDELAKIGLHLTEEHIILVEEDILFRPSIRFLHHLPQLCEKIQSK